MFKFIFGIIVGFMIFKFDWVDDASTLLFVGVLLLAVHAIDAHTSSSLPTNGSARVQ